MKEDREYIEEEIRTEFQLERMVLFSDAVFAIVVTLMAIEIHIPESAGKLSDEMLLHEIKHLLPVIVAYAASFLFVGVTWYQHLKIFSYLKDYDKGLVIRNLVLLFFIGIFPFSASIISRGENGSTLPIFIYLGTIILCRIAQLNLTHYILFKKPELCLRTNLIVLKDNFTESRKASAVLVFVFVAIIITQYFTTNPDLKTLSILWILVMPVFLKLSKRKNKKAVDSGKV